MCQGGGSGMFRSGRIDIGSLHGLLRWCLAITGLRVTRVLGCAVCLCKGLYEAVKTLEAVATKATVAVSVSRRVEVGRSPMVPYKI